MTQLAIWIGIFGSSLTSLFDFWLCLLSSDPNFFSDGGKGSSKNLSYKDQQVAPALRSHPKNGQVGMFKEGPVVVRGRRQDAINYAHKKSSRGRHVPLLIIAILVPLSMRGSFRLLTKSKPVYPSMYQSDVPRNACNNSFHSGQTFQNI